MPKPRVTESFPDELFGPLQQMGADIAASRRARGITQDDMAARMNVARKTVINLEKGDPRVGFGSYLLAAWVMGLERNLLSAFDTAKDPEFQRQARLDQAKRTHRPAMSDFGDLSF